MARSRIKRFRCHLAFAMTTLCLINVMWLGLSWNVIPVSRSCPREIRFESYSGTSAVSSSLIDLTSAKGIETVPISSEQMIFFPALTKSIDIGRRFENKLRSLQRCREASESRYHVLFFGVFSRKVAWKAVAGQPGWKGSVSSSSSRSSIALFALYLSCDKDLADELLYACC